MFIPHTCNECLPGPGHVLGAGQQGSSDGNDSDDGSGGGGSDAEERGGGRG